MALLMGKGAGRNAQRRRYAPGGALPCQKAGHIGILQIPGAGGIAYAGHASLQRPAGLLHLLRQLTDMLKQRVALPQAQRPLRHLQQPAALAETAVLRAEDRCGGFIIAGVDPQKEPSHGWTSCLTKAPIMPLIKEAASSES